MSGPIFGNNSSLPGSSGGNRHLVEFRAGRMNMVGKMVYPDVRKGMVYLFQDDGLIHFCWKDRTSGKVEEDLIIFPDDCEFKKVEQCKTGSVYLLKFKSSTRKLFFWMQEPKVEKNDEYCRRVNDLMNNPPSATSLGGGRGSEGSELQYMINNMSQQQLMQLFGGVGQMGGLSSLLGSMNRPSESRTNSGRTDNASVPGSPLNFPRITHRPNNENRTATSEMRSYLDELATGTDRQPLNAGGNVDLSTDIATSEVKQLVNEPERAVVLAEYLPSVPQPAQDELQDTLTSPQFQQSLSMFCSALQSGQIGPVLHQFNLSAEAISAANSGDLERFVKALEKNTSGGTTDEKNAGAKAEEDTKTDEKTSKE